MNVLNLLYISRIWRLSLFVVLLITLFIGAFLPQVGQAAGPWHSQLHILAYAVVGFVTYWSFTNIKALWSGTIILSIPVLHEVLEIWGHHHQLEVHDILLNLIGVVCGSLIAYFILNGAKSVLGK
ncbi:hypothetical protein OAP63_13880 [Vibrio sp.]|uniref:VanZ family protein n=1 Tax=Vibrio viridaestus TaxID=2487322 RepID=A0A3N9TGR5_9VIBR|nr:hypothetical protein [Vibrio viridaestus]MDC0611818.1 hypothetical protein [Vibrio sp.]RQW63200.1 hypothetical protein EES38_08080 [Vibrio viridaestus]